MYINLDFPQKLLVKRKIGVLRGRRHCFYLVLFRVVLLYFLLCLLSKTVKWKKVVKLVTALYLASLSVLQSPGKVCAKHKLKEDGGFN